VFPLPPSSVPTSLFLGYPVCGTCMSSACTYFFASLAIVTCPTVTRQKAGNHLYLLLCFSTHCYIPKGRSQAHQHSVPTSLFLDSLLRGRNNDSGTEPGCCTYFFVSLLIVTWACRWWPCSESHLYLLLCFSTHCYLVAFDSLGRLQSTVPTSLFLYSLLQQRLKGKHFR